MVLDLVQEAKPRSKNTFHEKWHLVLFLIDAREDHLLCKGYIQLGFH